MNRFNFSTSTTGSIGAVLLTVLFLIGMFFLAWGIFQILAWLAPFFLIAAFILNYRIPINYGKWLIDSIKESPAYGILMLLLTIVGFPIVCGWLFLKSLLYYRVKVLHSNDEEQEREKHGEYIDFEELEEEESDDLSSFEDWQRERPYIHRREE